MNWARVVVLGRGAPWRRKEVRIWDSWEAGLGVGAIVDWDGGW